MKYLILLITVITLLTSCEKEEKPVPLHDAGDVVTNEVEMTTSYKYQLYFDLETNSVVGQNLKTDWDLGFEASPTGNHIILNTAKRMYVANTNQNDFAIVTDTIGLTFGWDEASGNLDSTGVGTWMGLQEVYVFDRGYDALGAHLGFKKMVFLSVNASEYQVRFANLDGTEDVSYQVDKDADYNFIHLSLSGSGAVVSVQPKKEDWDILFTQYTHIFYDEEPVLPYLVTGIISNRNKVEIAEVFDKDFLDITFDDVALSSFGDNINQIGHDWKYYDLNAGQFVIFSDQNYIIKSTEGVYYKIHFIDFYNNLGEKGTPVFEFQEL